VNEVAERTASLFRERFGEDPPLVVQAPGRVNLIGEHTDYNEGFVFPAAIDRWAVLAARPRADETAAVYSAFHGEEGCFGTGDPLGKGGTWVDYVMGVVHEFQKLALPVAGFEGVLGGDVPNGAGLSSSAAVEMAIGRALLELGGQEMPAPELALLGQRAENGFVGVNCGIMDQFVSANARAGHALFLDCRDLSFELVPVSGGDTRIVICNSGVTRGLTDSAYNNRRSACEEGASLLAGEAGRDIRALRDVTPADLDAHGSKLPDEILRRCRHVVTENDRTQQAVSCLKAGDTGAFGELMDASHASLRDDYEVSGPELDLLVETARAVPGVLGARMTGAGFGGCTVNLVAVDAVDALVSAVEAQYRPESGSEAEVYVCNPVNGAERVV